MSVPFYDIISLIQIRLLNYLCVHTQNVVSSVGVMQADAGNEKLGHKHYKLMIHLKLIKY